ncbi:hypothetical protein F0562_032478 [Nyssa sinensis]|uniref:Uncharacterized protein n=1 Tax=Nyssa sinensis TaxID=561372 RepID=A0A5J5AMV0_9ASTE|nr:hypothetical protein F0562_032478 [Nyssa sinensis]
MMVTSGLLRVSVGPKLAATTTGMERAVRATNFEPVAMAGLVVAAVGSESQQPGIMKAKRSTIDCVPQCWTLGSPAPHPTATTAHHRSTTVTKQCSSRRSSPAPQRSRLAAFVAVAIVIAKDLSPLLTVVDAPLFPSQSPSLTTLPCRHYQCPG